MSFKIMFDRFKIKLLWLSCIYFPLLLASSLTLADAMQDKAEKTELTESQLKTVNKKILDMQAELGSDKSTQKKQQKQLRLTELEINKLHKEARKLTKQQKQIKTTVKDLQSKEKELLTQNAQQETALASDLRNIYKIGAQEKLKLLLNQEKPEDIARILEYYDYYSQARVTRIRQFQQNIVNIQTTKAEIETQLAELEKVKLAIQEEQENLKQNQKERESVVALLKKSIKSKDSQLKALQADQARLGKLLKSLKDIWSDIPKRLTAVKFSKHKGKLIRPASGKLSNRFGTKRAGGKLVWNGIFIQSNPGNEVKAVYDGRVVFSDWLRGYGLLIIVDHSDGYLSLYGHNASLLKESGDWISAGETLATIGKSGGYERSGLYFGIRKDGKPQNPKYWLKK